MPIIFHEIVRDHPGRRGLPFVIARNFSARLSLVLSLARSFRPLEGFWALSRINIRECVQTRRVGRERAGGWATERSRGRGRRTNGRRRRGRTRWEHVSRTEIVNYSFVLRRAGVGRLEERRSEYRAAPTEKEGHRRGGGDSVHVHMAEMHEGSRCNADGRRGRERDGAFLFHRTVETRACCHEGRRRRRSRRMGGRARERGERERGTKNEDEVNDIHAGYRIPPSRASEPLPSFRLCPPPLFFSPSSRALRSFSLSPFRASYDLPYFTLRRLRPHISDRKGGEGIEQSRGSCMREDLVSSRSVKPSR